MKRLLLLSVVFVFSMSIISGSDELSTKVADFTLEDLEGDRVTLSDLDGLIILDFWATWCPPCKVEIPYLQDFYDEYKEEGLHILGISTEDISTQKNFKEQMKTEGTDITYTLLVDPDRQVTREYRIEGIPTTIFVDSELNQIEREVGFIPEYAINFRKIIEANLPEREQ